MYLTFLVFVFEVTMWNYFPDFFLSVVITDIDLCTLISYAVTYLKTFIRSNSFAMSLEYFVFKIMYSESKII